MTNREAQERILVIKLGALGDFIQGLGPMAAIRKHHKNAHITLLTTQAFKSFAHDCGYFDEVWIDQRPKWFNLKKLSALHQQLNNAKLKRVYDLQNNDRTNFYFKLFALGNRPEWVGTAKGASHRNTSPNRTAGHAFDGHVQTLGLAGITNIKIDTLKWMHGDVQAFPLKKPYILLVPGSAPSRPEKRWPADQYSRLAKMITSMGYQPVILGTETERDLASLITKICPESLNLTGRTNFSHITTLARNATYAIGNDTGPMHLIGATGCASIVLFSKHSNPVRHAPKGENITVLQKNELRDLSSEDVLKRLKPPARASTMH